MSFVPARPAALLFDFDGTLADTAPDMAAAANELRARRQLPPLPTAHYRPHVSRGARGLVGAAFDLAPGQDGFDALRDEFLDQYERQLYRHTRLFDGIDTLLDRLEACGIAWGIVTNKAMRFTGPLVRALQLERRTPCIVGGDTTAHTKPHPAPLLHAAALLGVEPARCWYLGDDERDMQAARAAGMAAIIAAYGYLHGRDWREWDADRHVAAPLDLLALLDAGTGTETPHASA